MHFIPYYGLRNNINDWLIHTNVFYSKRWFARLMMRVRSLTLSLSFSIPFSPMLQLSRIESVNFRHRSTFAPIALSCCCLVFLTHFTDSRAFHLYVPTLNVVISCQCISPWNHWGQSLSYFDDAKLNLHLFNLETGEVAVWDGNRC